MGITSELFGTKQPNSATSAANTNMGGSRVSSITSQLLGDSASPSGGISSQLFATTPTKPVAPPIQVQAGQTKLTPTQLKQVSNPYGFVENTKLTQGKSSNTIWDTIGNAFNSLFGIKDNQFTRSDQVIRDINTGAVVKNDFTPLLNNRIQKVADQYKTTFDQAKNLVQQQAAATNKSVYDVIGLDINKLSTKGGSPIENTLMEDITKELGVRNMPTNSEAVQGLMTLAIGAGLIEAPISTIGFFGIQSGVNAVKNGIVNVIKARDIKGFDMGKEAKISELLPDAIGRDPQVFVDVLEFIGTGMIAGSMVKGFGPAKAQVIEDFTKKITTEYTLPKTLELDAKALREMQIGGKITNLELNDAFKKLQLTADQRADILKGRTTMRIDVPAERITTIADQPWFKKIKEIFKVPASEVQTMKDSLGKTEQSKMPKGFLPSGESVIPPGSTSQTPPVIPPADMPDIKFLEKRVSDLNKLLTVLPGDKTILKNIKIAETDLKAAQEKIAAETTTPPKVEAPTTPQGGDRHNQIDLPNGMNSLKTTSKALKAAGFNSQEISDILSNVKTRTSLGVESVDSKDVWNEAYKIEKPSTPQVEAPTIPQIDNIGEKPVFHGTNAEFDTFDTKKLGSASENKSSKVGFFFTDSKTTAESYGKNVKQVYLDLKNPKVIDAEGKMFGDARDLIDETVLQAKKDGNDGVIIKNLSDRNDWGNYEAATHYVVFDTQNIKTEPVKTIPPKLETSKPTVDMGVPGSELPSSQKPIGTGKLRESSAYKHLRSSIEEYAQQDVNYNQLNSKNDTENAIAFVESAKPEKALRVALGLEEPPKGQSRTNIALTVAAQAKLEGNSVLQSQVLSSLSLSATRGGQENAMLRGKVNENSELYYIRQLMDKRLTDLGNSTKASIVDKFNKEKSAKLKAMDVIDRKVTELTDTLKKRDKSKIKMAQDIIDSLICK